MTHTLDRIGLSENHSGEEIVILCMVHYKHKEEKSEEIQEIARTVLKYKPNNFIGFPLSIPEEYLLPMAAQAGIVTAVFTDMSSITSLVRELREKALGISVVLSGLFSDVRKICDETGLTEHTTHYTAGVFGKTDELPDHLTLEITTQCGHALVSSHYVSNIVKKIRKGMLTSEEGAELLAKPCVCGIVNKKRTAEILAKMAQL
ncbi:MAG: hypothetical protein JW885_06910 [Deltaproteobacteria bacterium]|nr:hypothetical protein [Candidatus Zymogenaceae bacterium]